MKLFLIFILLILIYSKNISTIDNEPLREIIIPLDPPVSELYSDWVKYRFNNMWFSCRVTPIHNQCKLDVNSFFQIVLNSTDDYSSYANYVYSVIKVNVNKYPNNTMRKENSLINIIKYIDNNFVKKSNMSNMSNMGTRAVSDTPWNSCCRFFVWIFRLNEDLCD